METMEKKLENLLKTTLEESLHSGRRKATASEKRYSNRGENTKGGGAH